jgi:hypothetical protein
VEQQDKIQLFQFIIPQVALMYFVLVRGGRVELQLGQEELAAVVALCQQ